MAVASFTFNSEVSWVRRLCRVGIFILIGFGIDAGLSWIHQKGFDRIRTGESGGLINWALENKASDIFFFGSSRTQHHIDPRLIESITHWTAFNAGCDGQGIHYARMLQEVLLSRNTTARIFVLEDMSGDAKELRERALMFRVFQNEVPSLEPLIREADAWSGPKSLFQTINFNSLTLPILFNLRVKPADALSRGFEPVLGTMNSTGRSASGPKKENEELKAAVQSFVQRAKSSGKFIVFLLTPKFYSEEFRFRSQKAKERAESWANEMDVPLVSVAAHDYPEFQDPNLYSDYMHLNNRGAAELSKIVGAKLFQLNEAISKR